MIVQNLQPVAVDIETLGPWRLDGRVVETGTVVPVLPSLAADLIARGKARRFVAPAPAVEPEAVAPVDDAPPPDPETPPAPTPFVRGRK